MSTESPATAPRQDEAQAIDRLIAECEGKPGELLTVLEGLQQRNPHNYLSREALGMVAQRMGLPLSQVLGVATFYAFFNLEPQGRHTISVCRGTACHTRGSRALLDDLETSLGVDGAEAKGKSFMTTPDRNFTIRTVACFGQCALAPVVEVDHQIHGYVSRQGLRGALAEVLKKDGSTQKDGKK
jgi:NADH-quinone oxidoreductase subunit E